MAISTLSVTLRLLITAGLIVWAVNHEYYLPALLLMLIQGLNFFSLSAILHDLAH